MDTAALQDFVILAECLSFSRAAELRHVTQPAFSRRIKALEQELGVNLLERHTRAVTLTTAGQRFLQHARQLLAATNAAKAETAALATQLHTPVFLSSLPYVSKAFFPLWYRLLQQKIPQLRIRLMPQSGTMALAQLRLGQSDFALLLYHAASDKCHDLSNLQRCVVQNERLLAVCAANNAKKSQRLLQYEPGGQMQRLSEVLLGKKQQRYTAIFESNSVGLLKEMCVAGFGTAILPESTMLDELDQGLLKPASGLGALDCQILLLRTQAKLSPLAEAVWQQTLATAKARNDA